MMEKKGSCWGRLLKGCLWVTLIFLALVGTLIVGPCFYRYRTIDRDYVTYDELMAESRARRVCRFLPATATDIHYFSNLRFGSCTERFSCKVAERDFVDFARSKSYPLATNAFKMLDYAVPEAEGKTARQYRMERMARDHETQTRLVFGKSPHPSRYFSYTDSHEFDGGACSGSHRNIIVYDRDSGRLVGYLWMNWL